MASRAFRRVAAAGALAGTPTVLCDTPAAEARTEVVRAPEPRGDELQEGQVLMTPAPKSRVILEAATASSDDEAKAAPTPSAPPSAESTTPTAIERHHGGTMVDPAERTRRVLELGASLARERAVQEAVMRHLGGGGTASGSQWTNVPSLGSARVSRDGSEADLDSADTQSLGLSSLPSSYDGEHSGPGAFFSDHWCWQSEDFHIDSLVTDESGSLSPAGQPAGEAPARTPYVPAVLEESEVSALVHDLELELERKDETIERQSSEIDSLRRKLRIFGVDLGTGEDLEDEEERAEQETRRGERRGSGATDPAGDAGGVDSTFVHAALAVAALIIMLTLGRRGSAMKGIGAAVAWIKSVVGGI